jgi:hypothetical protein
MDVFAGIRIRDFQAARPWYETLLGNAPSFLPHDTEAVWELGEHRFVYIVEDPERAGSSVVTLIVEDLEPLVEGIAERGIEPAVRETYANGVRKITFRDPDGNEVAIGGVPE